MCTTVVMYMESGKHMNNENLLCDLMKGSKIYKQGESIYMFAICTQQI